MQRAKPDELALIWQLTPPWRKCVLAGEQTLMVPNPDGWGTQPVPLRDIEPDSYVERLSGKHVSDAERDRNRRLFAVWEECATILRRGLRDHRRAKRQAAKEQP